MQKKSYKVHFKVAKFNSIPFLMSVQMNKLCPHFNMSDPYWIYTQIGDEEEKYFMYDGEHLQRIFIGQLVLDLKWLDDVQVPIDLRTKVEKIIFKA